MIRGMQGLLTDFIEEKRLSKPLQGVQRTLLGHHSMYCMSPPHIGLVH